jgi:hypothetical protein
VRNGVGSRHTVSQDVCKLFVHGLGGIVVATLNILEGLPRYIREQGAHCDRQMRAPSSNPDVTTSIPL